MKKPVLTLIYILCLTSSGFAGSNTSLTYNELISYYEKLQITYPENAKLVKAGSTDCGKPLSLFILSDNRKFDPETTRKEKTVLFINNGIHPGEPDGMDASIQFASELLENPAQKQLLKKVTICIVPVFNIDGALRRSCCSRANQNGPDQYGFRGNYRNLDLNRDFMKTDASNTQSLIESLRAWDPDVFIDTHVSDGADYSYTLTIISSQHSKMNGDAGAFLKNFFTPSLFEELKKRNCPAIPYVDTYDPSGIPDSGIVGFFDSPRFASGYQSLFNCFSFITETHMLKPFDERVKATKTFLSVISNYCNDHSEELKEIRKKTRRSDFEMKYYPLRYDLDTTKTEWIDFKGYQAVYKKSEVTGMNRLYYNHTKPFDKKIRFFDHYSTIDSVRIPDFYVIPQAWKEVLEKLRSSKVNVIPLEKDSSMEAEFYFLDSMHTVDQPYEGHYLHSDLKTSVVRKKTLFFKGDVMVPVRQRSMRFILEALEPKGVDSYFSWGFFDAVLQQKEWFSPYVFEDLAANLLQKDEKLKADFLNFKRENPMAGSFELFYFIYRKSPYFEKESYRIYPVGRIVKPE